MGWDTGCPHPPKTVVMDKQDGEKCGETLGKTIGPGEVTCIWGARQGEGSPQPRGGVPYIWEARQGEGSPTTLGGSPISGESGR